VAGEDVGVFEGIVVFVFGKLGIVVTVRRDVVVLRLVGRELNDRNDDRVDVFDAVAEVDITAPTFANSLSFTRPSFIIVAVLEFTRVSDATNKNKNLISISSIIIPKASFTGLDGRG
jgi:hypothetical protein